MQSSSYIWSSSILSYHTQNSEEEEATGAEGDNEEEDDDDFLFFHHVFSSDLSRLAILAVTHPSHAYIVTHIYLPLLVSCLTTAFYTHTEQRKRWN